MATAHEVRLGSQGRLVIPAELRELMGAEEGAIYTATVDDTGALVLRTRQQALSEARQLWAVAGDASAAAELARERRAEAANE